MQHTRLRVDRPSEDGEEKRAAIGRLRTGGAWFLYFYLKFDEPAGLLMKAHQRATPCSCPRFIGECHRNTSAPSQRQHIDATHAE